jgi:hypothetical protein
MIQAEFRAYFEADVQRLRSEEDRLKIQIGNIENQIYIIRAQQDGLAGRVSSWMGTRPDAGFEAAEVGMMVKGASDLAAQLGEEAGALDVPVTKAMIINSFIKVDNLRGTNRLSAKEYRPSTGLRSTTLTYMVDGTVHTVNLGSREVRERLEAIGRMRFDTRFVRNMFFVTNVVRLLRLKLQRELTDGRGVLAASHQAVAAAVTEFGADPFGPNETLSSRRPGEVRRYADEDR